VPHYIAVIPQRTVDPTLTLGKNFTISIYTDYNGTDIWGWQFALTFNPVVLEGVEVVNGDLITGGDVTFIAGDFNNTKGELGLTASFFNISIGEPLNVTSGPGILANVTFKVVGEGDSYITLEDHTLIKGITEDGYGDGYNIIDYITDLRPDPGPSDFLHGYFRNTVEPITHDIAILSVTPSPSWIEIGEPVSVTVVVKNNGTRIEKGITIELYYGYISPIWFIETQTISTLEAGANTSLTFTWNTTDVWHGTYQVSVVANSVHGETDTGNNALNESVIVSVFYIKSNGSIDPFWAPILSVDNVTYTFTSDILNVSIVVERDDIVVDGAGYTLQAKEGWPSYVRGIDLSDRNNVTIKNVRIKGFGNGIRLYSSSNNIIYHNNFIDNTKQVYILESGYGNLWDAGYPSGGNYWSDYTGIDEYSGSGQNETGSDGIGDTPYVIDENNQDNYPLMNPWTPSPPIPPPPPTIATVDVNPDTLNLKSKGRWITAHIELPEDYNASNIDRSTILLNDTIPVDSFWLDKPLESVIGDYDNDGITDLMVKFDRQALIDYLKTKGITDAEVTLAITGKANEKSFKVTDTIKVIGQ
jgi:parallel beta-helix repeat protein